MGSNIIELAKLGHERAAELKASCGAVDVRSLAQLMSDLATQLEVQFVRSTNMAVQLANAESKCRELATVVAENAALKKAAEFATAPDMWIEQADGMLDYRYCEWYVDVLKAAMETQETDAYLAEVRAQGVDAAIDHLSKKFEGTGHIGVPVIALEWLAQEIRKGASL
ncbi:hypothetical protein XY22_05055 [Salmonella enterica subsp. enterica]|nr:hypothetical protein [Salmonella enterica subsp. enterica]EDS3723111.1 hypothetical protein [Salmonella enterica subsp. enterica]